VTQNALLYSRASEAPGCGKIPDVLPLLTRGVPQTPDSRGMKRNHDRQSLREKSGLSASCGRGSLPTTRAIGRLSEPRPKEAVDARVFTQTRQGVEQVEKRVRP
jgi:hypothetical protein